MGIEAQNQMEPIKFIRAMGGMKMLDSREGNFS